MNARSLEILNTIVQTYIATGEPVPSRTISRRGKHKLSAASVRNVMADLCEAGYLAQPHTSSGRVPTEKAFRAYVQTLPAGRPAAGEVQRLRMQLSEADTVEDRVERSSHMLTELTMGLGIAAAIPAPAQTLEQIELVALSDRRVLMIVSTKDKIVRQRIVLLEELVSQDELNSIRNYLNRNFGGWLLGDVRRELKARLERESATYDAILKRLTILYAKGLLEMDLTPRVHMEGAANLVGVDLHLTHEKMRELFLALEEKKRVLHLLDQFLELPAGEVAVQVGLGNAHPAMCELSLIGLSVQLPGGLEARIAVLGPMRMNYIRAMAAVMNVGQAFRTIPA